MPLKKVKAEMETVNERLSKIPTDTKNLEQAIDDARTNLEEFTPDALDDFVAFVSEETTALEAEHPDLTAFINRVMVTLSNIGI